MFKELVVSLRPSQWYKNIVLFVGIVFSSNLFNSGMVIHAVLAFAVFIILSGSVYVINDIIDKENDKRHPMKSKRPVAAGLLKTHHAALFAILVMSTGIFAAFLINANFLIISLGYVILTLLYSFFLKKFYIVDILSVSTGFAIRAVAGCLAINVPVSPWIVICTFLLASFLAAGKRRYDYTIRGIDLKSYRKIFEGYSKKTLERIMKITAFSSTTVFLLYVFFLGHFYMALTIPITLLFFERYFSVVRSNDMGAYNDIIFNDKRLLAYIVSWSVLVILILYIIPEYSLYLQ